MVVADAAVHLAIEFAGDHIFSGTFSLDHPTRLILLRAIDTIVEQLVVIRAGVRTRRYRHWMAIRGGVALVFAVVRWIGADVDGGVAARIAFG